MKNIECAYTFPRERCKRQELLLDYESWRAWLEELKMDFKSTSRCGNPNSLNRQEILIEDMAFAKKTLEGMRQEFQEIDTTACKNCPRG